MINLERIVFATDFSEYADAAKRYACFLAHRFQAELHLLHVVYDIASEIPEFAMGLALPGVGDTLRNRQKRLEEEAMASLKAQLDVNWRRQHHVEFVVRTGAPFLEIIRYARKVDADLIVLGTHGRTGLSQVLIGSVAEKVVRKADCPVLTIRPAVITEDAVATQMNSSLNPAPAG